jgi:hypothetical protein
MITVVSVHLRVDEDDHIKPTDVVGHFDAVRDASGARAIGAQLGVMIGAALALRLQAQGMNGRPA